MGKAEKFINKNQENSWFQSIVPIGCRLGEINAVEGESYVQFFIEGVNEFFHYEIFFFDEKTREYEPNLKRYEVGMAYVEFHAETKRGKKWMKENGSFLALLNDKFRGLGKSFVKEWGGVEDEQSYDTGFAFRPQDGIRYEKGDEEFIKKSIAEQLKKVAKICNPIIHEANNQAKYHQWQFFLAGGELLIESSKDLSSRLEAEDSNTVEMLSGIRVADMLVEEKISIPDYQRKYCWGRMQVKRLLESIWFFPWEDDAESDLDLGSPKLHLGTIVLHENTDPSGQVRYDIVDGQQRLITLSILFKLAKVKIVDTSKGNMGLPYRLLGSRKVNEDFKRRLCNNAKCISEWLAASDQRGEDDKLKVNWLKNIQVDALIVKGNDRLGLVYTFFNAINSAGKKLTDYDLLKPHHLRYLAQDDPKGYFASGWDDFVQEMVPTFGRVEEEAYVHLSEELMDCNLYRLRSWSRNRPISSERHHVFNHFTAYSSIVRAQPGEQREIEIDIGLGGGRPFFFYVMEFSSKYRDFVKTPVVVALHNFQASWRHAVLLNIIRALLFQYYCKFGDIYLSDALVFIAEHIGKIRATETRIVPKKTLQLPIVSQTVEALDESPSPEFFFGYCTLPTHRYVHDGMDDPCSTHIKPAFWLGVKDLLESLQEQLAFRQNKSMRDIYKSFGIERK